MYDIAGEEKRKAISYYLMKWGQNAAALLQGLYMVSLNQLTKNTKAKEYYLKNLTEGKTKKHALRCLMKRTGCLVYGMLKSGEAYRG